jgi:light-harvesting protein B-800-850 alpha chain
MNNAKMWLVVKPTVGVPLFLGGVAVTSLAVHVAVISSGVGAWYGPYVTGSAGAEGSAAVQADEAILPAGADASADMPMYLEVNADGTESMRVVLPDGRTATLLVDDHTLASAQ